MATKKLVLLWKNDTTAMVGQPAVSSDDRFYKKDMTRYWVRLTKPLAGKAGDDITVPTEALELVED